VSDKNSYWSLTQLGKKLDKRSRRIQLEEGISTFGEYNKEDSKEDNEEE